MKFNFAGFAVTVYEQNLLNDNLPFVKIGDTNIATKDAKSHIDNLISFISYTVEACSIVDERCERYSIALNVLTSAKGIFTAKMPNDLTKEATLIAIDVIKEIALVQPIDDMQRKAIKSAAFISKLAIEGVDRL